MTAGQLALADDAERARDLRRMKGRATALLLLAAAVFIAVRITWGEDGAAGYVVATAEAAMVGGLADWFAVTALFRHPLRLPIPHTAIIPERKDSIGRSLGGFVEDNFLNGEVIGQRLAGAGLAARAGDWLVVPENAASMADQFAALVRGATEVLRDDDVQAGIEHIVTERLRRLPVSPIVGKAVDVAVEGGHHQALLEAALQGLDHMAVESRPVLREQLAKESPWWMPEPVDDRIFEKIFSGLRRFVAEMLEHPDHEIRRTVDQRVQELAQRLKDSPEMRERGDELRDELLNHPEVRAWIGSLWSSLKEALVSETSRPDSEVRRRIEASIVAGGESLRSDPALQAKVDHWLVSVATYLAEQSRSEVSDLIASTVARWDPDDTARRIEAQVGRDLQFIRINGTVVGGLAGLVIHTLAHAL
ncbi:MAG: DUF445 domain-containing protein [Acidimicrobiales bacterium]|nr:DUF445 domain-containing protein [Acidimicrobiales bacterium]